MAFYYGLDHYVEFSRRNDQIMVWVGLTGAGIVLGPHFVCGNLDTRILVSNQIPHNPKGIPIAADKWVSNVVAARWCSCAHK